MATTAERAFDLISSAHQRGRLAHAFLISGAVGSGKENLAARIIQAVKPPNNSGGMDLFGEPIVVATPALDELESGAVKLLRPHSKSRRITVDGIRELEHTMHLSVPGGGYKIGVILDADRMNEQASNAFLKTLEEPPHQTLLLLVTSQPQRLLPTILSRCVSIKLTGGSTMQSAGGDRLVAALNAVAKRGFGTPLAALQLKAVFTQFLAEIRAHAEAAAKEAEKEEIAAYRDATDGSWLKERKIFHEAAAEAEYLDGRARLFDVLSAWLADLLRLKVRAGGLDFPDSANLLRDLAEKESEARLLRRMDALESLRRTLETNAFETLALEVGFLESFGP